MEMSAYLVRTSVTAVGFLGGTMGAVLLPILFWHFLQPSFGIGAGCLMAPGLLIAQIPSLLIRRLAGHICDERGGAMPAEAANRWILASFCASLFVSSSFMAMVWLAARGA
jgi:hypothetical protein